MKTGEQKSISPRLQSVKRAGLILLGLLVAVLLLAEWMIHKHPHFVIEKVPYFYCLLGFLGTWFLSSLTGLLQHLLSREVDYYDS